MWHTKPRSQSTGQPHTPARTSLPHTLHPTHTVFSIFWILSFSILGLCKRYSLFLKYSLSLPPFDTQFLWEAFPYFPYAKLILYLVFPHPLVHPLAIIQTNGDLSIYISTSPKRCEGLKSRVLPYSLSAEPQPQLRHLLQDYWMNSWEISPLFTSPRCLSEMYELACTCSPSDLQRYVLEVRSVTSQVYPQLDVLPFPTPPVQQLKLGITLIYTDWYWVDWAEWIISSNPLSSPIVPTSM